MRAIPHTVKRMVHLTFIRFDIENIREYVKACRCRLSVFSCNEVGSSKGDT